MTIGIGKKGSKKLLTLFYSSDIVLSMQHTWQICTLQAKEARWSGFHVTMNPKGMIYLNGSAMKALDNSDRLELRYDEFNNTIGLKPTNSLNVHAFKAALKGKHGGRKIRAFRLLKQFQIKLDCPVRFLKPEMNEEGMMVLDLRQTSVAVRKRS
jgi:hypothetical protein